MIEEFHNEISDKDKSSRNDRSFENAKKSFSNCPETEKNIKYSEFENELGTLNS